MRCSLVLVVLVLVGGCRGTYGPRENRLRPGVDPLLSIPEQKERALGRYSIPFDDPTVTPKSYSGRYGPTYRQ